MKSLLLTAAAVVVLLGSCQVVSQGHRVSLPEPVLRGLSVEEVIAGRRSVRSYREDSLSLAEVSQILFAGQGVTGERGGRGLRSAPSAGGTYPIELYLVANRVAGLDPGVYHYVPEDHSIDLVKAGAHGDILSRACLGQSMPKTAAISIVMTAVRERTTSKYGQRGIQYIHMEAGHVSQNICLQSVSLGLGAVPVGAFDDHAVDRVLGVDGENERSLYVNCIGKIPDKRGDTN
jgi:SagB-type dehydrogenase family enzyme